MNKQIKYPALFLLSVAVLSGCFSDRQDSDEIKRIRKFEEGRRFESPDTVNTNDNIRMATDMYQDLISQGNRYGEYGLAKLLMKWYPEYEEDAVRYFIACAKRSDYTSELFPDSAMDSAFSAAAMAELSDIAKDEHNRQDIADSLHRLMSKVVTESVKTWAYEMKTNVVSAKIYEDVISAVESCDKMQCRGYVKHPNWDEIDKVFINGDAIDGGSPGGVRRQRQSEPKYSVIRFVKTPGATFRYDFEFQIDGSNTVEMDGKIKSVIRRQLQREFLDENPHVDIDDVRTSFPRWNHEKTTAIGSAVVMSVSAVTLEYDGKDGKISVRLDGRNLSDARRWAIENIGELASSKNVVLVAGRRPPPGAVYKTGKERTTEDGLLEIEFTTRPNDVE